MREAPTGLYLIADREACGDHGVLETARAAVAAGVRTVQVRDKLGSTAGLLSLVRAVADAVGDRAAVIVNDRVDVFLAARTQGSAVRGVHLGQDDLPPELARRLIGEEAILGLSAQSEEQFRAVGRLPKGCVDYLGVGAVHATTTKPDHPPALGIDGFAGLAAAAVAPCVAIGGIGVDDVPALRRAGAAAVAVASAIGRSADPHRAALALVGAWRS